MLNGYLGNSTQNISPIYLNPHPPHPLVYCLHSKKDDLWPLWSPSSEIFLNVSAPGLSFRSLNWTCYYRTPLCQECCSQLELSTWHGSSVLCKWLSLWCSVPWINHLPTVRWYIFRKSSFKRKLLCKYARTENVVCHCFISVYIFIYIYLNVLRYNNTLFFQSYLQ